MTTTFEVDEPELEEEMDFNENDIEGIDNDFGDEDEGEIPPELAKQILRGKGNKKAEDDGLDVKVSGPQGKTILGKHIRAKLQPGGLYKLYFAEGGELPDMLKGQYTDRRTITTAIEHYLATAKKVIIAA